MDKVIQVKVIPNAKKNELKMDGTRFKAYVTVPPIEGKANRVLINILAQYFSCKRTQIKIIRGERSKNKFIKISY
jgi:hypothetical protein